MFETTFHANTTATPEQYVAGLTDFGPGRAELFGNSADGYLEVHSKGATEADVTEGSGGVWERLRYDWSDPDRVVLTTTDSNAWGGRSGHTYTFTRNADRTTDIDYDVVRDGKNPRANSSRSSSGPSPRASSRRPSPAASRRSRPATTGPRPPTPASRPSSPARDATATSHRGPERGGADPPPRPSCGGCPTIPSRPSCASNSRPRH